LVIAASAAASAAAPPSLAVDVAAFGGTVCAVAACVAAARMNASCAIVEPSAHLYGMTSGGLSAADLDMPLGGVAREIFGGGPASPSREPRVWSALLDGLLAGAGPGAVSVLAGAGDVALYCNGAAPCANASRPARLEALLTANGTLLRAAAWVDCSYGGDLMRLAGVDFAVGREAAAEFNESLAGVAGNRPWAAANTSYAGVSPWLDAANTTLLPTVRALPEAAPGEADGMVMSYNYRLCLTNVSANSRPFLAPAGYAPAAMEVARRWLRAQPPGAVSSLRSLFLWKDLPNGKADVNQGPFPMGSDVPSIQVGWPMGSSAERAAIEAEVEWWTRAAWEFLREDESVPPSVRAEARSWALPLDEWATTGGFPPQIYVREAARLRGAVVMTQADVLGAARRRDPTNSSVGLSLWCVDEHLVQRLAVPPAATGRGWEVLDEWLDTCRGHDAPAQARQLSEIPIGALIPRRGDALNLLVPVCASFSHIAYSTFRLEPQFAIFGQSAAVAAVLAIRAAAPGAAVVQDVDIAALQAELRAQGVIIDALPMPAPGPLGLEVCNSTGGGGGGGSRSATAQIFEYTAADSTLRCGGLCATVSNATNSTGASIVLAKCHPLGLGTPDSDQSFDVVAAPLNTPLPSEALVRGAPLLAAPPAVLVRAQLSGLCVAPATSDAGLELLPCGSAGLRWVFPASPLQGAWQQAEAPAICVTATVA